VIFCKKEDKDLLGSKSQSIIMIEKKPSEEELGKMVGKEKLNVNEQEENKDKIGEKNSFEEIKK